MTESIKAISFSEFSRTADRLRNWGRWGKDDQIGTLNFITADTVREAARLVRQGKIFPLGVNFEADGIWSGNSFRRNPMHLMMVDGGDSPSLTPHMMGWDKAGTSDRNIAHGFHTHTRFADDMIIMPLQAATQWDALSHVWYDGQLYNGYPESSITSRGATKNSIDQVDVKGIVSRGVLLDMARHRGVSHLPPNTAILPRDLDEVCSRQRVEVRAGDIVLVRTGWWPTFKETGDGMKWITGTPGLGWQCAQWLHEHQAAAVASDNVSVEVYGDHVEDAKLPFHLLCLRDMGLMLGEIWNLEALAADCAADGVYEMQLIAPPLRVTGAVGSPINPIALK